MKPMKLMFKGREVEASFDYSGHGRTKWWAVDLYAAGANYVDDGSELSDAEYEQFNDQCYNDGTFCIVHDIKQQNAWEDHQERLSERMP